MLVEFKTSRDGETALINTDYIVTILPSSVSSNIPLTDIIYHDGDRQTIFHNFDDVVVSLQIMHIAISTN